MHNFDLTQECCCFIFSYGFCPVTYIKNILCKMLVSFGKRLLKNSTKMCCDQGFGSAQCRSWPIETIAGPLVSITLFAYTQRFALEVFSVAWLSVHIQMLAPFILFLRFSQGANIYGKYFHLKDGWSLPQRFEIR